MKVMKLIIARSLKIAFIFIDIFIPKNKNYWIFPVYFLGEGNFSDNILAVFDFVKNDSDIKKIILTRAKRITITNGANVLLIKMNSLKAIWYLMRAKIFIIQHSLHYELGESKYQVYYPWRRHIINLWHAITIKNVANKKFGFMTKRIEIQMPKYYIISSSLKDKSNMEMTFYKTSRNNFWITGLPRNDFLLKELSQLPESIRDDLSLLQSIINGKKLIIYAPTYRVPAVGGYYYSFTQKQLRFLRDFLKAQNFILGLRYHGYNEPVKLLNKLIDNENIIDLSSRRFSNMNALIREASIIITDYSSVFVDALYLKKRLICFAYDYEHYLKEQHGFFYDFESVFPGRICKSFDELMIALERAISPLSELEERNYTEIQTIFFKYIDVNNSERVVSRIKELIN